jgi:hypothetical protein
MVAVLQRWSEQMNWNDILPYNPSRILALLAAVLVALAGSGWALYRLGYDDGRDIGAFELSARKAMDHARIPEMTKVASIAKEPINTRADTESIITNLRDQLQATAAEESRLRDQIAKLDGETRQFSLKLRQAEKIGSGYAVGLMGSVGITGLRVNFNNMTYDLRTASSLPPVDINGKHCTVRLLAFDWAEPSGDFELSCQL